MSVSITLTDDEVLVLVEFTLRFTDTDKLEINHHAERVALWNLGGLLEKNCAAIFDNDFHHLLSQAQEKLAEGSEWP